MYRFEITTDVDGITGDILITFKGNTKVSISKKQLRSDFWDFYDTYYEEVEEDKVLEVIAEFLKPWALSVDGDTEENFETPCEVFKALIS